MNKRLLVKSLLSLTAFLFLLGCAVKEPVDLPAFSATQFDTAYQSKVDNFVLVFDASSSMRHDNKFTIAKNLAERLNLTIPELGQTAGLRSFGHAEEVSKNHTELFYGMDKYSTAGMSQGLESLTAPGGWSPLGTALDSVNTDLEGLSGVHNAVIIISDGLDMEPKIAQVQALKDKYGSSVCFYPIQVGDSPEGKAFLQEVAAIGDCGFLTNASDVMIGDGMAAFVEKVFLMKKAMAAAPTMAVERKDSDGDGVYDALDRCPGTPAGANVNAVGCWTLDSVLFDYNKAAVKPESYSLLDAVVVILEKNPGMNVELQGHTDNTGSAAYNMGLSIRRADAVANYLEGRGISSYRMTTAGFGFKVPVALNNSDFGRSLNRRVDIMPK
jgi:OOP family OmpA-OmpF porin